MPVRPELLEILACPKCKQAVEFVAEGDYIFCPDCQLRYLIRDDIPVMLIDEGNKWQVTDKEDLPIPPPKPQS